MNKIRLIESLKEIIGFHIGIYTNDGEHIEGVLSEIKDDFLIIKDKNYKTFFFNIDKIQAFSKNTRKFKVNHVYVEPYFENSLMEIIDNYQYSWVTVHCQHKLTFSGVLTVIEKDHIILTINDEKLYIQKDHIITFQPEKLKPTKKSQKDGKKPAENEKGQEPDKSKSKDEGKKHEASSYFSIKKLQDKDINADAYCELKKKNEDHFKNDKDDAKKHMKDKYEINTSGFKKAEYSDHPDTPVNKQKRTEPAPSLLKEKDNALAKKFNPDEKRPAQTALKDLPLPDKKKTSSGNTLKVKTYYGVSFRKKKKEKTTKRLY